MRRLALGVLLTAAAMWPACNCGTGAGDPAPCQAPPPVCEDGQVSALEVFSLQGCNSAVNNYWCGVNAQELAQCLRDAQVCLQAGGTRAELNAALAASPCAAQFQEWDGCFGNGEAGGGGGGGDD